MKELSLLAQKLKELRQLNNYTQEDVAVALGIARQTYSHYETSEHIPSAKTLHLLAGLYNISAADLLSLTMDIDWSEHFDAPALSQTAKDLQRFMEYCNSPSKKRKLQYLSKQEKEMLFYFEQLSSEDQVELTEFAKIKSRKS